AAKEGTLRPPAPGTPRSAPPMNGPALPTDGPRLAAPQMNLPQAAAGGSPPRSADPASGQHPSSTAPVSTASSLQKPEDGRSLPNPAPGIPMRQEPSTSVGSHHGTETMRRGSANGAPVTYDRPMPTEAAGNLKEAIRHGTFQEVRYLAEKLGTQPAPIAGSLIPPFPKLASQPTFTGSPDVVASDT